MRLIDAKYEIEDFDGIKMLKKIERIGRVCYKSESKTTDDSYLDFVQMIMNHGHEAMIEHCAITVKFICDRGISHEVVRHRIASYAQESTRYCNYELDRFSKEVTFIIPSWFEFAAEHYDVDRNEQLINNLKHGEVAWLNAMKYAENKYFELLSSGWKPEQARSVLPNSLKTEIVMTMDLREWRHFLKLRTAKNAHPQMRELTIPLLAELKTLIPIIFDDIEVER